MTYYYHIVNKNISGEKNVIIRCNILEFIMIIIINNNTIFELKFGLSQYAYNYTITTTTPRTEVISVRISQLFKYTMKKRKKIIRYLDHGGQHHQHRNNRKRELGRRERRPLACTSANRPRSAGG